MGHLPRGARTRALDPATRAYTDYLLRTAALGDYAELVAVLLPCMWGYSEAGQRLSRSSRPSDARYAQWIEMYAAAEFAALAGWCREVCDEIALPAGPQTRDRMQTAFLTSSRHALAFGMRRGQHSTSLAPTIVRPEPASTLHREPEPHNKETA